MSRTFSVPLRVSLAIFLALLPIAAFAAPVHGKRQLHHRHADHWRIHRWHGYGFLPGYHQPPNNSVPNYALKRSSHGTPDYAPSYWYGGDWYYYGNPRFFHGRYNGGSFGPCWTSTPIGLMWNCG
jgi:hypothetical protein